jgi:hypothetical protein
MKLFTLNNLVRAAIAGIVVGIVWTARIYGLL